MVQEVRAALYARVSSKAQAEEDKVSIGEQFGEMESYCERRLEKFRRWLENSNRRIYEEVERLFAGGEVLCHDDQGCYVIGGVPLDFYAICHQGFTRCPETKDNKKLGILHEHLLSVHPKA